MGPERTPRPGQGLLHKWQVDPSTHFQPITVLLLLNFPKLHSRWSAIKVLLSLLLLLADDLVRDWAQPGEASEAQPTILRQQKSDNHYNHLPIKRTTLTNRSKLKQPETMFSGSSLPQPPSAFSRLATIIICFIWSSLSTTPIDLIFSQPKKCLWAILPAKVPPVFLFVTTGQASTNIRNIYIHFFVHQK